MCSEFTAIRIRPANRDIPRDDDGALPEQWLIAEWPNGTAEPTDFWIANLPVETPIATMVRLAKIRWRTSNRSPFAASRGGSSRGLPASGARGSASRALTCDAAGLG